MKVVVNIILALSIACASITPAKAKPARQKIKTLPAKQLMVVITDNWDAVQGNLYCYKLQHGKWVLQFKNAIVVGAKGLGVGDGIMPLTIADAPVKKEGDNKSPAGVFTIGTAFGYADYKDARWIK